MTEALDKLYRQLGIDQVLRDYPGLSIRPSVRKETRLVGELEFSASYKDLEQINDRYEVEIFVPDAFPKALATARETAGRVPKDFHTNPDGTLCLGSPVRQYLKIGRRATVSVFIKECLIPYLYGFSYKEHHGRLPWGELKHNNPGIIQDYMDLFQVQDKNTCVEMLWLCSLKKRVANKKPCPCRSGHRVGKCHNNILNSLRKQLGSKWFKEEYKRLSR